jgi:hypothetical protein
MEAFTYQRADSTAHAAAAALKPGTKIIHNERRLAQPPLVSFAVAHEIREHLPAESVALRANVPFPALLDDSLPILSDRTGAPRILGGGGRWASRSKGELPCAPSGRSRSLQRLKSG